MTIAGEERDGLEIEEMIRKAWTIVQAGAPLSARRLAPVAPGWDRAAAVGRRSGRRPRECMHCLVPSLAGAGSARISRSSNAASEFPGSVNRQLPCPASD